MGGEKSGWEGTGRTCSALTTSMMTPPFSIWARPALTAKVGVDPLVAVEGPWPLGVGRSLAIGLEGGLVGAGGLDRV